MATTRPVSIKLFVDTKKNKVLFAEVGKNFVDFLFNLLTLPVGSVIHIFKSENMVRSLGNLYRSLGLKSLLKPHNTSAPSSSCGFPLLLGDDQLPRPKFFRCDHPNYPACRTYVTGDSTSTCPGCGRPMICAANWVVKKVPHPDVVTYMVMDDLEVKPMSTSLVWNMAKSIKEVVLEEKDVILNLAEGLKLLKESFVSQVPRRLLALLLSVGLLRPWWCIVFQFLYHVF